HTRWPRDWSSDVCSFDLVRCVNGMALPQQLDQVPKEQHLPVAQGVGFGGIGLGALVAFIPHAIYASQHGLKGNDWKWLLGSAVEIGRASCRERRWGRAGV